MVKWDGPAWLAQPSAVTSGFLCGVWGVDANNVWAVGESGAIEKWNGTAWALQPSGATTDLCSVWGADPNNIWAVGLAGTILHKMK